MFVRATALLLAAAVTFWGQTPPDPADTLARARVGIVAALRGLPKYTCVQTIDRSYFTLAVANSACDRSSANIEKGHASLRLNATDRVRLNVALGPGIEIHSW